MQYSLIATFLAALLLAPAIVVAADAGDDPQESQGIMAPAIVVRADTVDEPQDDDNSMRPTKRGLRLTPEIALGFSRMLTAEAEPWRDLDLTEEQQSKMADVTARRLMQTGHAKGKSLQRFLESLFEGVMRDNGGFTPETGRKFAEAAKPALPALRECLNGIGADTRPILRPDQLAEYEKHLSKMHKELDRFEGKMKRWADGGAKKGEEIDDYEPEDGEDPNAGDEKRDHRGIRHARRTARWELNRIGPAKWAQFLSGVKYFFKLSEEQSAKADQLLADYRQRAEAVMTDEWEKRVLRNRTKVHLCGWLGKQPTAPWRYHLDREYQEAVAPVKELGRKFREEVFALISDEQREAALASVRETAEKHGMTMDESDVSLLGLKGK